MSNHTVDVEVCSTIKHTPRVKQLGAMFDVPLETEISHSWKGALDFGDDWQIGLIAGPSGCGKSVISRKLFGNERDFQWDSQSVIDDFSSDLTIDQITKACSAVGFNTVPSWMKPFRVLSNGEQFRVHLARTLLESGQLALIDEFSSVVDRQVAKIASHAVQKFVRGMSGKQFVAVSCHYDIVDWLQPDWILEPVTMKVTRRSVQPRPEAKFNIYQSTYEAWSLFSSYHYLTASLNKAARCFVLANDLGQPVSLSAVIWQPMKRMAQHMRPIVRLSRSVTLPDWQGIGLSFALKDVLGAAYKTCGFRLRGYPAHPGYVRSYDRSRNWTMKKRPGAYSSINKTKGTGGSSTMPSASFGGRPCAVFEYVGPKMDPKAARSLLRGALFGRAPTC